MMVYNRNSVWLNLYTAYERMIVDNAFPGLDVEEAFTRNTDGEECPISRCYTDAAWASLCEEAGFTVEYLGGYLSLRELQSMRESWASALVDERLDAEHREFLRELTPDPATGLPVYAGRHAGIGGSYRLRKA